MAAPFQQVMTRVSGLTIKEKVRAMEALSAFVGQEFEMANKYKILDQNDKDIFYAVEQTDCLTRQLKQCCNDCAAWNVDILYTEDGRSEEAFKLHRDFTLTCCCLNRPKVDVKTASGQIIGSLSNPCRFCNLAFDIMDKSGQNRLRIDGGCCQWGLICPCPCGPCSTVNFDINDASGKTVGGIKKKVPGIFKFLVASDADNYHVDFGSVQDPVDKILLMAAAIFVDFRFFNNNKNDGQGYMPVLSGDAMEG